MHNDSVIRLSLALQTAESATGSAKVALESTQKQIGFVPNMYAAMANAPELLDTYMHGYQLFRASGQFTPVEQEVLFLTISIENGCRYCVAAHSMLAGAMSKVPPSVTEALRRGEAIPDPKLAALAQFTSAMVRTRGRPTVAEAQKFLSAGYTERQILDVILAIAVKTLSNYSNHVFHTPVDAQFAQFAWTGSSGS